jgi:transcriptional regulator GlxA family with amidase domain
MERRVARRKSIGDEEFDEQSNWESGSSPMKREDISEQIRSLSNAKMEQIIEYIDSNLHRNVTLSELSALVQLTPGYFCSAFKQEMGRPPHRYLIEQRVERAQALLRDADLPLTEVALDCGFSSQSHMNNHFRRIIGVTPARYRTEMRVNKAHISRKYKRNEKLRSADEAEAG